MRLQCSDSVWVISTTDVNNAKYHIFVQCYHENKRRCEPSSQAENLAKAAYTCDSHVAHSNLPQELWFLFHLEWEMHRSIQHWSPVAFFIGPRSNACQFQHHRNAGLLRHASISGRTVCPESITGHMECAFSFWHVNLVNIKYANSTRMYMNAKCETCFLDNMETSLAFQNKEVEMPSSTLCNKWRTLQCKVSAKGHFWHALGFTFICRNCTIRCIYQHWLNALESCHKISYALVSTCLFNIEAAHCGCFTHAYR